MKIRMILMALAALLCLASCSDDDSGIQLTEDEVVGDIITGKQIVINTLTTYTDSGSKVNVNGAKGKVSATSSDDSVAKVSCSSNESEKEIYVSGVSEGNDIVGSRFLYNVIPHELTGYGCLRSFWLRYRVLGIKNVFAMQYFCIFGVYYYVENN